ncbi:MAG: S41 family peptidase [Candidatus Kapabacteria bacterium]|nr:S41 family peptidase [Candidatus Kapabacteria bacterium]MCS7169514.1 S41 family peptidase [Candidatus Kapabacteria bacterium]MDW7997454.1 S41 family peptidase [Bacteroidota bacterium]MDW8224569.1 S41 family peptidase [Bacteroidota bacterium]
MEQQQRRVLLGLAATVMVVALGAAVAQEPFVAKVTKVLDILSALLQQVVTQYVEPVDPEAFLQASLEAMLKQLDPYTRYIDEEGSDELDILSTGAYTGIGVVTASRDDSLLTVVEVHEGSDAWRAGVRVGDRIYQIDSMVVLRLPPRRLRHYTRGEPGTTLRLVLLRERLSGGYDTLRLRVRREEIRLPAVTIARVLRDSVGYVRLERFSRRAVEEMRQALSSLRQQAPLRGLIVDVRDNPGGLLDIGINVCGLFVPPNLPLITVRGRDSQQDRIYYAHVTPIEAELPLAVLVNGGSASASEIFAGVLQDLDRALIVGAPSVGKGLVQSVLSLPYGAALRLTTARYYMPSGRSPQKGPVPVFAQKELDSMRYFTTRNGRVVVGNSGIQPDTLVLAEDSLPEPVRWLQREGWIFRFATAYAAQYKQLPPHFRAAPELLSELENFLARNGKRDALYPLSAALSQAVEHAAKENVPASALRQIERLLLQSRQQERSLLIRYQADLLPALEREILSRFMPHYLLREQFLSQDRQLAVAAELVGSRRYYQMLAVTSSNN